MNSEKEKVEVL